MLKISDILKKAKKRANLNKEGSDKTDPSSGISPAKEQQKETVLPEQKEQKFSIPAPAEEKKTSTEIKAKPTKADNSLKKSPAMSDQKVVEVYEAAISCAQEAMNSIVNEGGKDLDKVSKTIEKLINCLEKNSYSLLLLVWDNYFDINTYVYQHAVNVCVLCLQFGKALPLKEKKLRDLGIAALFHDLGLVKFNYIITQSRMLNQDELRKVKTHPLEGKSLLNAIDHDFGFEIAEIVAQEHERIDGSGYPHGLKDKAILEFAQIIGLCDTYEAIMHKRPYRDKRSCRDAIKEVISHKNAFEHRILKCFVNAVGIFPVTTKVKLNTKEVGTVIRQNLNMPMRPVVFITHNIQGQELESSKEIDLSSNFSMYIKECFTEIKLKD